jgi:hypothetical protein
MLFRVFELTLLWNLFFLFFNSLNTSLFCSYFRRYHGSRSSAVLELGPEIGPENEIAVRLPVFGARIVVISEDGDLLDALLSCDRPGS